MMPADLLPRQVLLRSKSDHEDVQMTAALRHDGQLAGARSQRAASATRTHGPSFLVDDTMAVATLSLKLYSCCHLENEGSPKHQRGKTSSFSKAQVSAPLADVGRTKASFDTYL